MRAGQALPERQPLQREHAALRSDGLSAARHARTAQVPAVGERRAAGAEFAALRDELLFRRVEPKFPDFLGPIVIACKLLVR
jgi:hypothetical protein